jgi:3-hydroxyacyl-CoA dehydrogenase/enoyl-CoA hydratase/3-hydroxybutyryl-CoA epimerase
MNGLRIQDGGGGVACLIVDVPGQALNTLSTEMIDDLRTLLGELEADPAVLSLVVASGKPAGFIAGAKIDKIGAVRSAAEAQAMAVEGQGAMALLEAVWRRQGKPVVAVLHGAALGGGLELALACSHRLASADANTQLGLPEVRLGLLPGAGGTQRLPQLVGVERALDLILSGRSLGPEQALRWGLVDALVPGPQLLQRAIAHARALAGASSGGRPVRPGPLDSPGPRRLGDRLRQWAASCADPAAWRRQLAEQTPLGQRLLFYMVGNQLRRRTGGHYPAPERALAVVRCGQEWGLEAGYAAEAKAFGELAISRQSRALVRLFFSTQALKKKVQPADLQDAPRPVSSLGVIGGGLMGGGIAAVSAAYANLPVHLKEVDANGIGRGQAYVQKVVDRAQRRRRMTPDAARRAVGLVTGTTQMEGLRGTDLVIEAAFEDLALKRALLADFEACCSPTAVFASNTSALSISAIAAGAVHPERVIGMHYFSPVEKMPLLEVGITPQTAAWVTATCVALGQAQNKTVIVVRDSPGFYTTRVLAAYLNEACWLLQEGVDIGALEAAARGIGFAVGPCTLMDEIGIDVSAPIEQRMHQAFGERFAPPAGMRRLLADGRLGRKAGRGFFVYRGGKKKGVDPRAGRCLGAVARSRALRPKELQERLLLRFVNEAAACLAEEVVGCARDADVGAVLGLGFPPFLGGPLTYVDQQSAGQVVQRLEGLQRAHGPRLRPVAALVERARSGALYYPRG